MFGIKKLKEKVSSLERELGLLWDDYYRHHEEVSGGRVAKLDEIITERYEKKASVKEKK